MGRLCGLLIRIILIMVVAGIPAVTRAAGGRPVVTGVRTAAHDGVTRFVVDLSTSVPFKVRVEADPAQVVVDLPELDWHAAAGLARPVGLIRNYAYMPSKAGSGHLLLQTEGPVTVRKAFIIPPAVSSNYRLVVDLATGESAGPAPAALSAGNPLLSPPLAPAPAKLPVTASQSGVLVHHADGDAVARGPVPAVEPVPAAMPAPVPAAFPIDPHAGLPARPGERKPGHGGKPIVVIDPGHGGIDPGATSLSGAYEKNIVLALARDVKEQLDKDGKVTCLLTRDRDIFIPLRERIAIGRADHADLFMSLHADTVADPEIKGLSVYTLSQTASDAEAQALADKENKADIVAGIDLSNESPEVTNILIDLVQRESMNLSAVFAQQIIRSVSRETHELLQNTHRFAGFAVLKAPDIPSVLVETGYLSNERDEQMLRSPEYRAKLATALARAIENYFARTYKARRP